MFDVSSYLCDIPSVCTHWATLLRRNRNSVIVSNWYKLTFSLPTKLAPFIKCYLFTIIWGKLIVFWCGHYFYSNIYRNSAKSFIYLFLKSFCHKIVKCLYLYYWYLECKYKSLDYLPLYLLAQKILVYFINKTRYRTAYFKLILPYIRDATHIWS